MGKRGGYDYLIVGAGLYGATFARRAFERGAHCLVIDKRPHIAGNCYDVDGNHRYGPHIFHTSSEKVWGFVNRFAEWRPFHYTVKAQANGTDYTFPVNSTTLKELGMATPDTIPVVNPRNMRDWLLANVGRTIYERFYEGYSTKLWGCDPVLLPCYNASRIPAWRNDRYFTDKYEVLPTGGYTGLVRRILDGIEVRLSCPYPVGGVQYGRLVWSGKIDEYYKYRFGMLPYRSVQFDRVSHRLRTCARHYCDLDVPFLRDIDYRHFGGDVTVRERAVAHNGLNIPMYPVRNSNRYDLYASIDSQVIFGGRLGTFQYLDMDKVIAQALRDTESI
jgi:UDP-galactopyranose mutase